MRNWINILSEAETKTKKKTDLDIMPKVRGDIATTDARDLMAKGGTGLSTHDAVRSASGAIATAAQGIGDISPDFLAAQDTMSDEEAAGHANVGLGYGRVRPTADNLPALVYTDIVHSGQDFNPEWHQIKHLPGYMLSAIRAVARQVFERFTTTPIEDIQMICTILNPDSDVRRMVAWIKENGVKEDEMNFDFSQFVANYSAHIQIWRAGGFQFALCRDMGGHYVYGWPENDRQATDLGGDQLRLS